MVKEGFMLNVERPVGLRPLVRGFYQLQKLRIQTGNRLVNHFMAKLGVKPGEAPTSEVGKLWKSLKRDHKRVTDALARKVEGFPGEGLISGLAEFALVDQYFQKLEFEKLQYNWIKKVIEKHPVGEYWLENVNGVGPLMAGVLLSELDFSKARYPSSFWKYAGLDVVNGEGRGRKRSFLESRDYIDRNGQKKQKLSLTYNPFLKSKLLGVLAVSFLKSNSPYRQFYDNYKQRLENHVKYKHVSKGRRARMATRYMIKIFLKDYFIVLCRLSGRKEPEPYGQAKLGLPSHPTPFVEMKSYTKRNP